MYVLEKKNSCIKQPYFLNYKGNENFGNYSIIKMSLFFVSVFRTLVFI